MEFFFEYAVRSRPTHNFARAGEALDLSDFPEADWERKGAELAEMLLTSLDAIGYYIDVKGMPANPGPEVTRVPLHPKTPQFYLVKKEGIWLLSKESVARIEEFHNSTVSPLTRWLTSRLPSVFIKDFMGVAIWQMAGLFICLFVAFAARRIVLYLCEGVLSRLTKRTSFEWDDRILEVLGGPVGLFIFTGVLALAFPNLQFGVRVSLVLRVALTSLATYACIWLFYRLVDVIALYLEDITAHTDTKLDDQIVPILRKTLKTFVVIIGVVFVLQNLNVNVGSLLAGLGLGGLAFALAAKDSISNLFGSIMILIDRPFQIGDWVIIGKVEGTVEEVGLRSTRVRTFYKSLVTIPNAILMNSSIDNMGMRNYRRIKTYLSLTYSTTSEQMEAFVEGVRQIIEANEYTWKDYYHVYFNQFGSSSLDVLLYCFVDTDDWGVELKERHRIFLEIVRLAEEVGVEFAFPTQTLHVDSFPDKPTRPMGKDLDDPALASVAAGFGPGGNFARPEGVNMRGLVEEKGKREEEGK